MYNHEMMGFMQTFMKLQSLFPYFLASTVVDKDEFPRDGTTVEGLQKLRPAFITDGSGSVTAGNASGKRMI